MSLHDALESLGLEAHPRGQVLDSHNGKKEIVDARAGQSLGWMNAREGWTLVEAEARER